MMGILSWTSKSHFDHSPSHDLVPFQSSTTSAHVGAAAAAPLVKRKRSFDFGEITGSANAHAVKAPVTNEHPCKRVAHGLSSDLNDDLASTQALSPSLSQESPVASTDVTPDVKVESDSLPSVTSRQEIKAEHKLAMMRQTISTQLNLEILLKHKELRLIDQELAKCQVALEQLRRCTEIPYPAMQSPSEQVSLGQGAAIRKSKDKYPPRSPAPWGVTDGPYTRHYAKWLLPDSHFDGGKPEVSLPADLTTISTSGRHIRGNVHDFAQLAGKTSRSQRALNHAALPAGYGEPKPKPTGPMILKRKSDGRMVKLVCPDCGRHDFGSAQGFINHCRIGHQRNFASHDAAAEGCGEPVELDESGIIKGAPTEMTTMSTSIHSLVRSAKLLPKDKPGQPILRGGYVSKAGRSKKDKKKKSSASSVPQTPACTQAPYLSAFVLDKDTNVDLQALVDEAKTKIEPSELQPDDDDMVIDSPIPHDGHGRLATAGKKQSVKSTGPGRRIGGSKQMINEQARRQAGSISSIGTDHDETQLRSFMTLLPSPTNESTQAPSLIDDDEEMEPHSPMSTNDFEETDIDVRVRDDEHSDDTQDLRVPEVHSPHNTCTPQLPQIMQPPRPLSSREDRNSKQHVDEAGQRASKQEEKR